MGRALFLLVVGILVLWSWASLDRYFALFGALRALPPIERAYLSLDPEQNFLTLAGRPDRRKSLSEREIAQDAPPLQIANRGQWAVRIAETLPPDARVYLNTSNSQLYFHSSFLWYPARVEVSAEPALIRDPATLRNAHRSVRPPQFSELLDQGYSHIVVMRGHGPHLLSLSRAQENR